MLFDWHLNRKVQMANASRAFEDSDNTSHSPVDLFVTQFTIGGKYQLRWFEYETKHFPKHLQEFKFWQEVISALKISYKSGQTSKAKWKDTIKDVYHQTADWKTYSDLTSTPSFSLLGCGHFLWYQMYANISFLQEWKEGKTSFLFQFSYEELFL